MADTAHKDAESMKERVDAPDVLEQKIQKLANMIKASKHMVCFTGAGISTSAGIHDFRGPKGKWTREAKGLKPLRGVPTISAYPTKTHMAIVQLARNNKLKWLISQNCDGLHVRSGFPQDRISELHGNGNVEICEKCGQRYFRDLCCYRMNRGRDHFTGRYCVREACEGRLLNSTIDFGQNLPTRPLRFAEFHSERADLHVALGSSLTVTPAADCPRTTSEEGGALVIINLQKTPLTDQADFQIFGKTDEVMERVMKILKYEIPPFRLVRKLIVGCEPESATFYSHGCDVDDETLEMDFVRNITWGDPFLGNEDDDAFFDHTDQELETEVSNDQFLCLMGDVEFDNDDQRVFVQAEIEFSGNYREPNLSITLDFTEAYRSKRRVEYLWTLEYNPYQQEWTTICESSFVGKSIHEPDSSFGNSHANYCMSGLVKVGKTKKEAKNLWNLHVKRTSKKFARAFTSKKCLKTERNDA